MEGADLTPSMVSPVWTEDVEYEDEFPFNRAQGQEANATMSQEAIKNASQEAKKDQVVTVTSQETNVNSQEASEEFITSAEQLAADIAKVNKS